MGFLTRWIASGIDDGAERDAALRAHITSTTAKCDELCVRRGEARREDARDSTFSRDRGGRGAIVRFDDRVLLARALRVERVDRDVIDRVLLPRAIVGRWTTRAREKDAGTSGTPGGFRRNETRDSIERATD